MERVELAKTGIYVTRLGFGGCPLGGHGWGQGVDRASGIAAVRRAFELGINFFDTADIYGLGASEEALAEALGSHRHEVVIASKCGVRWNSSGRTWRDIRPSYLRQAIEGSLRRLQLDCLSVYYIHWPDGRTPIEDAMESLERMREAGKIRAIAVSNFSAEQLQQACRISSVAALQIQYSLVDQKPARSVLAAAQSHGVPFVTWGSLAQGLLSGKFASNTQFGADDRRHRYENFSGPKFLGNIRIVEEIKQVAKRLGVSPAQVALRWLLQSENVAVVLVGAKTAAQIEENAGALSFQLPQMDYQQLQAEGADILGGAREPDEISSSRVA